MTHMSINVPTFFQPNRKTKRRELNKQILKRQGRHHRQQTPPPASRYNLDEDTASDDYEEYNQGYFSKLSTCSSKDAN